MNCKKGDLAVIVESSAGNEGKFVTCVEFVGKTIEVDQFGREEEVDTWRVDRNLRAFDGTFGDLIADQQLRPIRPQSDDATDEMLLITGLPEQKEVA